jgi:predicted ATPase
VAGVSITDGCTQADVLAAVAAVFGVARADQLRARLAEGGPALLVVDGVERGAAGAVSSVTWLRSAAPSLRLLATSRHPLGIGGEHTWPVPPLEVPPPGAAAAEVTRYAAVGLFLERLRRVRQHPVGPEENQTLAELVRRLGGLPLALELAAARGRVLELGEILTRYGDRVLDLDTGDPAGATLRDAVAASCRLLDPTEWACLQWLVVFCARWSMEMAEELLDERCAGRDVVALVDRLVALGLVSVRPGTTGLRFRLADVVRDYVLEQGSGGDARDRHAVLMANLVTRMRRDPTGTARNPAVTRLDYLSADLRAALDHTTVASPHVALRIAAALPRWWRFRGRAAEGRALLRRLLDDPRTATVDPQIRVDAMRGLAYLGG